MNPIPDANEFQPSFINLDGIQPHSGITFPIRPDQERSGETTEF